MNRKEWIEYAKKHPGKQMCWCGSCEKVFTSPFAFDKHRKQSQCLSEAAMRERGMDTNARGVWISKKNTTPISVS